MVQIVCRYYREVLLGLDSGWICRIAVVHLAVDHSQTTAFVGNLELELAKCLATFSCNHNVGYNKYQQLPIKDPNLSESLNLACHTTSSSLQVINGFSDGRYLKDVTASWTRPGENIMIIAAIYNTIG